MKTNSQTIAGAYGMRSRVREGRRAEPPLAQRGGTLVGVVPEPPDPHPGAASKNQTSQIATITIRTRAQLRARPARTAAAVSVHPDVHDGVLVRAVSASPSYAGLQTVPPPETTQRPHQGDKKAPYTHIPRALDDQEPGRLAKADSTTQ